MKKIIIFLGLILCTISSCSKIKGDKWTEAKFDISEIFFDSEGGQKVVCTERGLYSWMINDMTDADSPIAIYPERDEKTDMEQLSSDNIVVRHKDRRYVRHETEEYDITVLPSTEVHKWVLSVSGAYIHGKVFIYQNCGK